MVEVLVAAGFVTAAVVALSRRSVQPAGVRPEGDGEITDLPCPWCRADTSEDDRQCPGCGQPFG